MGYWAWLKKKFGLDRVGRKLAKVEDMAERMYGKILIIFGFLNVTFAIYSLFTQNYIGLVVNSVVAFFITTYGYYISYVEPKEVEG